MKSDLERRTFNAFVFLEKVSFVVFKILQHFPLYGVLDGREDCSTEEEIDEVDQDQHQHPPSRSHLQEGEDWKLFSNIGIEYCDQIRYSLPLLLISSCHIRRQ